MTQTDGYSQFCPIALTAEIICKRWTALVLRALFCGARSYSDIHGGVPGMSSATLSQRLKELEHANIIERQKATNGQSGEYRLTEAGQKLFPILEAMGDWSQDWLRREITDDRNLNPDVLFWELRQLNLAHGKPVENRRVAEFLVTEAKGRRKYYWLVFESGDIDVCHKNPGHEVDLWVTANIRTLVEIWLGHVPLTGAVDDGRLRLDGRPDEIAAFRDWFMLSHFSRRLLRQG